MYIFLLIEKMCAYKLFNPIQGMWGGGAFSSYQKLEAYISRKDRFLEKQLKMVNYNPVIDSYPL